MNDELKYFIRSRTLEKSILPGTNRDKPVYWNDENTIACKARTAKYDDLEKPRGFWGRNRNKMIREMKNYRYNDGHHDPYGTRLQFVPIGFCPIQSIKLVGENEVRNLK